MSENRTIYDMARELLQCERAIRELKLEIQDELGIASNSPFVRIDWSAIRQQVSVTDRR